MVTTKLPTVVFPDVSVAVIEIKYVRFKSASVGDSKSGATLKTRTPVPVLKVTVDESAPPVIARAQVSLHDTVVMLV
jgi:hypothetical protein